ncbi:hypothetical protein [Candidatus Nanosyncoccus nanoralicus]|uniref:Uncharacterized protein n=1 Tax=Candidatus Nanosyncoccus nanoralicus TaxID=2171996 RepID=A0ABY0FJT0_9BACT|nr:hypothetical protein [Candidatus Nanosyncoccus nanoralicus]RYC73442.1 hypothetical protein G3KMM_00403 [Candidatus Nanosyncoccus nanoralicus]
MAKPATRKQRRNKAPIFIIFFFILAIIATIIVLKIFKIIDHKGKPSSNSETTEIVHQKTDQPSTNIENQPIHTEDGTKEDAEAGRTPKTPEQYEGQDVNQLDKLTGTITYSEKSGDKYRIRVNINQFLKLPGTCKLTVTSASTIVHTQTVSIISNPSSGSCEGFDIPLSMLLIPKNQAINIVYVLILISF